MSSMFNTNVMSFRTTAKAVMPTLHPLTIHPLRKPPTHVDLTIRLRCSVNPSASWLQTGHAIGYGGSATRHLEHLRQYQYYSTRQNPMRHVLQARRATNWSHFSSAVAPNRGSPLLTSSNNHIRKFSERSTKIDFEIPPLDLLDPSSSLPPPPNIEMNFVNKMKTMQQASRVEEKTYNTSSSESLRVVFNEIVPPSIKNTSPPDDNLDVEVQEQSNSISSTEQLNSKSVPIRDSRGKDVSQSNLNGEQNLIQSKTHPQQMASSDAFDKILAMPPKESQRIIEFMIDFYEKRRRGKTLNATQRENTGKRYRELKKALQAFVSDPNNLRRSLQVEIMNAVRKYREHYGTLDEVNKKITFLPTSKLSGPVDLAKKIQISETRSLSVGDALRLCRHVIEKTEQRRQDLTLSSKKRELLRQDLKQWKNIFKTLLSAPDNLSKSQLSGLRVHSWKRKDDLKLNSLEIKEGDRDYQSQSGMSDEKVQRATELSMELERHKKMLLSPGLSTTQRTKIRENMRLAVKEMELLTSNTNNVMSSTITTEDQSKPNQIDVRRVKSTDTFKRMSESGTIKSNFDVDRLEESGAVNGSEMTRELRDATVDLGLSFKDISLLKLALTRESSSSIPYHHLPVVGGRVLNMAVADLLRKQYPFETKESLEHRHSILVCKDKLTSIAMKLRLGKHIRLPRVFGDSEGGSIDSVLSDSLESILAALYFDRGLETVEEFIRKNWDLDCKN